MLMVENRSFHFVVTNVTVVNALKHSKALLLCPLTSSRPSRICGRPPLAMELQFRHNIGLADVSLH
jgi:hypothetical protein